MRLKGLTAQLRRKAVWAAVLFLVASLLPGQDAVPRSQRNPGEALPMLRGASLLVGSPPFSLMVTNDQESLRFQPEQDQPETGDSTPIYASISRDGKVIAYARLKPSQGQRIVTISTYSKEGGKKRDYADGEYSGAVAISPDASKLAFSYNRREGSSDREYRLQIIDLKTGQRSTGPEVSTFANVFASWSPDSRRLAYTHNGEIRVWDTENGKVSKVADGDAPAWSPSGEWIAYLSPAPDLGLSKALGRQVYESYRWLPRCVLVHPDGTGSRVLLDLNAESGGSRFFIAPPVWSPDSKMVLFNELADVDTWTMDIHVVNLDTRKIKTLFRRSFPVLGWAMGN
jgi:Tol biopolymer transport system component